jgi:hypothetical protein
VEYIESGIWLSSNIRWYETRIVYCKRINGIYGEKDFERGIKVDENNA